MRFYNQIAYDTDFEEAGMTKDEGERLGKVKVVKGSGYKNIKTSERK